MSQGSSKNNNVVPIAALAAWALLIGFLFVTNSQERLAIVLLVFKKRIFQIILVGSIFLLAGAFGSNLLKIAGVKIKDFSLNWLLGTGIGLGVLGYLTLFLGLAGLFDKWIYALLLLVFLVFGYSQIRNLSSKVQQKIKDLPNVKPDFISICLTALLCLAALSYFVEALAPELDYDALEYHFGALTTYLADGRIHFLESNTYANFPALTEMLYLTAMILEGDISAKLINFFFGIMCVAAIICFCKKYFSLTAGLVSAAVFYIYPLTGVVSAQAFIDLGLTFFTFMGLWSIINWFDCSCSMEKEPSKNKWVALTGIYCGLACSCKYTALLLSLGVIVLLMAGSVVLGKISGFKRKNKNDITLDSIESIPFKKLLIAVVGIGIISLAVACPWYIKNYMATGNPFYPLLYKIFNNSNWDTVRELRFCRAHAPGDISIWNLLKTPWDMTISNNTASLVFIFFLPLFVFLRKKEKIILYLAGFAIIFYICWFYFTHQIDRFFMPVLPVLAIICGYTFSRLKDEKVIGLIIKTVLISSLIFNIYVFNLIICSLNPWGVALGYETEDDFLSRYLQVYNAFKYLNKNLTQDHRVLVVGEARIHYIKVPFLSNTVLDQSLLETIIQPGDSLEKIRQNFKDRGLTHILINWVEWKRLNETYSYMSEFNWNLFGAFEKRYLETVYTDKEHGIIIYSIGKQLQI